MPKPAHLDGLPGQAYYSGCFVSVHAIGPDGAIAAEPSQVLPTTRGCHNVQVDSANAFAFASCIAAGEPRASVPSAARKQRVERWTHNMRPTSGDAPDGNRIFSFFFDATKTEPLAPAGEITPVDTVNIIGEDGASLAAYKQTNHPACPAVLDRL